MRHLRLPKPSSLLQGLVLALLLLALPGLAQAASPSGILLVAFGTSMEEAKASLDDVGKAYEKACPDKPVIWAYTSDIIRKKLASEGKPVFSVREALDECVRRGIVDLRVQSLHVSPGEEYSMLERMLARYLAERPGIFQHLWLGHPLLESVQDLDEVIAAVSTSLPKSRTSRDAVVLMGHGNDRGPGDLTLACVAMTMNARDPLMYLASVEGGNSFDKVLPNLEKAEVKKVYLMPFMMVAGDHANNDLAGPEEDSWASMVKAKGMQVEAKLTGLGSIKGVQNVFLRHTKDTRDDLANPGKAF